MSFLRKRESRFFIVIPWLDHGILYHSLGPKIPRSSRGMTLNDYWIPAFAGMT
ncbi:MAG: hypothetical protein ACEY3D_09250 [Rickettsia sp.]|uniref:hypothetical protein n=1 Tax=Rickettsia sp. TaxID=789 RepID=UPI00397C293A